MPMKRKYLVELTQHIDSLFDNKQYQEASTLFEQDLQQLIRSSSFGSTIKSQHLASSQSTVHPSLN